MMVSAPLRRVDPQADHPALLQAYRIVSEALRNRSFAAGSRLPGERELSEQLGVSRSTIRQVLAALADSGMVRRSANRGWFVTAQGLSEGPNSLSSFTESTTQRGLTPRTEVLTQAVRTATLDEAELLGLAPAAPVLEVERRRRMDDVPVAIDRACLPLSLVPGLQSVVLTDRSLFETLQRQYGLIATRCDYQVQAESASGRIAELLGLADGAPVLVGYQTTFDQNERPIITGQVIYRGDAYRFKASLFRP